jgi:hypothetical protein
MREYDQIQNQCGEVPPPLRMPEAINLQHAMASQDLFSPYEELPIPEYLN